MLHECPFLWMPLDKSLHVPFQIFLQVNDQTTAKVVQHVILYDIVPKLVCFHMESCSEKTSNLSDLNCEALRFIVFFLKSKHDVSYSVSAHIEVCQYSLLIDFN